MYLLGLLVVFFLHAALSSAYSDDRFCLNDDPVVFKEMNCTSQKSLCNELLHYSIEVLKRKVPKHTFNGKYHLMEQVTSEEFRFKRYRGELYLKEDQKPFHIPDEYRVECVYDREERVFQLVQVVKLDAEHKHPGHWRDVDVNDPYMQFLLGYAWHFIVSDHNTTESLIHYRGSERAQSQTVAGRLIKLSIKHFHPETSSRKEYEALQEIIIWDRVDRILEILDLSDDVIIPEDYSNVTCHTCNDLKDLSPKEYHHCINQCKHDEVSIIEDNQRPTINTERL